MALLFIAFSQPINKEPSRQMPEREKTTQSSPLGFSNINYD